MKKKLAILCCGWSNYFLSDFINGVKKATTNNNIDIYIFNAYNYVEFSGFPNYTGFSIFSLINYDDFDGVIILSDLINNPRILEKERLRILKSKKNAISINLRLEGMSCLRCDNYAGFYDMIEHLIKIHELKDFAYITGKEKSLDITERLKAFRSALEDNSIPIQEDSIHMIESCNYQLAYDFMIDYIESGKKLPEVFVCANDLIALAVLKVAEEKDIKIPDVLKVVGYDDIIYGQNIRPSISSMKNNAEALGIEAVNRILQDTNEIKFLKTKSIPIYRMSCGCTPQKEINHKQHFTMSVFDKLNRNEVFSTQMEHLEEIFTEAADVFTLLTNLELFFNKSHLIEGNDFCIFLKSDWASVLINSEEKLPQNLLYGNQVQSIVSIQNGKKYAREVINTKNLIPSKMHSDENNTFLIMPIFNHSYVHGYFVTKNNLSMIDNHYGYTWTHTFGTCIERFRKKNMYKQMSQQFLRLSTKDSLSGMLNRIGLEKLAKPFYAQNKKNGLTTVLFFVDINSMKTINDKYGHLHGDLAVKTVSAAVLEVVPKSWHCIRYGGDEFLVVGNSKNYKGEDYCQIISQTILKKTSIMQLPYNLSASIGSYFVPSNSPLSLEEAVEKVDEIMYEQKQAFHKTH